MSPQIPTYFAQRLPEVIPGPRVQIGEMTAEERATTEFGGALSRVAGQLAEIVAQKQLYRDRVTLAEMESSLSGFEDVASTGLAGTQFAEVTDFEKVENKFESDWKGKTEELSQGKNNRVVEQFRLHTTQRWNRARSNYHRQVWQKERSWGRAEGKTFYNEKLRKGDLQGAFTKLDAYQQYFTAEELGAMREKAPHDIEWFEGIQAAENNPEWLLDILEDGEKIFPNLDPAERIALKRRGEMGLARNISKQNQIQQQQIEVLHQEYWQDLRQDNLTELQTKVDASLVLPVTGTGGKEWWAGLIAARTEEITQALEIRTDGRVRGDLLTEVYNIPIGAITKQQFQQQLLENRYVNRSIDDKAFDELWMKSEIEYKSWRGAQLQKALRAIRAQVITIDESTMERMIGVLRGEALDAITTRRQEEEDKYAEAVKEMDDWLAANPEPTRDDFYKQQRRILRDYRNKTAEQIRQGRAEFKEIQTTQPTEEQLKAQAAATNDVDERKRIYEQGRELGYWR